MEWDVREGQAGALLFGFCQSSVVMTSLEWNNHDWRLVVQKYLRLANRCIGQAFYKHTHSLDLRSSTRIPWGVLAGLVHVRGNHRMFSEKSTWFKRFRWQHCTPWTSKEGPLPTLSIMEASAWVQEEDQGDLRVDGDRGKSRGDRWPSWGGIQDDLELGKDLRWTMMVLPKDVKNMGVGRK